MPRQSKDQCCDGKECISKHRRGKALNARQWQGEIVQRIVKAKRGWALEWPSREGETMKDIIETIKKQTERAAKAESLLLMVVMAAENDKYGVRTREAVSDAAIAMGWREHEIEEELIRSLFDELPEVPNETD